jgi:acetyl-CoA hydrolase
MYTWAARRYATAAMASDVAAAAMSASSSRVAYAPARALMCSADLAAVGLCLDGHVVAWSGFTGVGYPKVMPLALLREIRRRGGPTPRLSLLSGASTGSAPEDAWAEAGVLAFRAPYQSAPRLTRAINNGSIMFTDAHLSKFSDGILAGAYSRSLPASTMYMRYGNSIQRPLPSVRSDGRIDLFVVEVSAVDSSGALILGGAVGASPELLHMADNIVIEVNSALPNMSGFHDLLSSSLLAVPGQPLALTNVSQRIGSTKLLVDWSRVRGVVATAQADEVMPAPAPDAVSERISGYLLQFFAHEVSRGRLPPSLPPLQSGIGNIANAVVSGLGAGGFKDLSVWSEVLQDAFMPLLQTGQVRVASTASMRLSTHAQQHFCENTEFYQNKIVLRQQAVRTQQTNIRASERSSLSFFGAHSAALSFAHSFLFLPLNVSVAYRVPFCLLVLCRSAIRLS